MKKAFCILTAIMLIFTALVFSASATGGTDGSVTWDYNPSSKVLTFSGSGAIPGYDQSDNRPWRDANGCKTLVIQSGVTGIGTNAFYTFNSLESVTIADSVKTIGRCAFQNCGELLTVSMGDGVTSIGSAAGALFSRAAPDEENGYRNIGIAHIAVNTAMYILLYLVFIIHLIRIGNK